MVDFKQEDFEELDLLEEKRKPRVYVIHHRDNDGYAAAAIALATLATSKIEFITMGVQYGEPFPAIEITQEDEVYILDFSYKREILDEVYKNAKSLLVLDHHVSAQKELEGTPYSKFDMSKSGVLLAWDYFCQGIPPNEAVIKLDCYDLWKKNHPDYDWKSICELHMACKDQTSSLFWIKLVTDIKLDPELIRVGKEIYGRFENSVDDILTSFSTEFITVKNKKFCFFFCERDVSLVSDYIYSNRDVDGTVCIRQAKKGDGWIINLRSPNPEVLDVSLLAEQLGGGGHRQAAGVYFADLEKDPVDIIPYLVNEFIKLDF